MRTDRTTNILLLAIALALVGIAVQPLFAPRAARAQNSAAYPVFIEPGVQMLRSPDGSRQVYGKVVVDLQTGKVWGYPTLTTSPYPVDVSSPKPPVSQPFLLGTFDFAQMEK